MHFQPQSLSSAHTPFFPTAAFVFVVQPLYPIGQLSLPGAALRTRHWPVCFTMYQSVITSAKAFTFSKHSSPLGPHSFLTAFSSSCILIEAFSIFPSPSINLLNNHHDLFRSDGMHKENASL